jgi:hypothetical protein
MPITYTAIDGWGKRPILALEDDARDYEAFILARSIEGWNVDWVTAGGLITIFTNRKDYVVQFEQGDGGQACADAIELLTYMTAKEEHELPTNG